MSPKPEEFVPVTTWTIRDDTLDRRMRGTTMDKRIVATFTGKFVVKKDRSSHPVFTLEISKIENLQSLHD
jgi:hypothetical protein